MDFVGLWGEMFGFKKNRSDQSQCLFYVIENRLPDCTLFSDYHSVESKAPLRNQIEYRVELFKVEEYCSTETV